MATWCVSPSPCVGLIHQPWLPVFCTAHLALCRVTFMCALLTSSPPSYYTTHNMVWGPSRSVRPTPGKRCHRDHWLLYTPLRLTLPTDPGSSIYKWGLASGGAGGGTPCSAFCLRAARRVLSLQLIWGWGTTHLLPGSGVLAPGDKGVGGSGPDSTSWACPRLCRLASRHGNMQAAVRTYGQPSGNHPISGHCIWPGWPPPAPAPPRVTRYPPATQGSPEG